MNLEPLFRQTLHIAFAGDCAYRARCVDDQNFGETDPATLGLPGVARRDSSFCNNYYIVFRSSGPQLKQSQYQEDG